MEKHVVVIYPHPDDESFGAAGTITKFRQEGVPVTYLCGTLGEMGRNMGSPFFATRESLPKIRKKELMDACKVLDMDVHMLGYRDKTVEFEKREEIAAHIKGYLEKIQPSLVITHYPEHAVHPDHDAMGAAAIEAVRMMDTEKRPTVWAQAITKNKLETLGKPDVIQDVQPYFSKKMEAVEAHRSQAEGMLSQFREELNSDVPNQALLERFRYEEFYVWKF
ncbi:bacillithiol biosynthesis deacetylase BshB2 [Bacillaceae bacterium S4-13-58]